MRPPLERKVLIVFKTYCNGFCPINSVDPARAPLYSPSRVNPLLLPTLRLSLLAFACLQLPSPAWAGLDGKYYNEPTNSTYPLATPFGGTPALTRIDPTVNFVWSDSPEAPINNDHFSVKWTGQVKAPATGNYTFKVVADDGVRLRVNGQLLIDAWRDQAATSYTSAPVALTADTLYSIELHFYEHAGGAECRLLWILPNGAEQTIPDPQLIPTPAQPSITPNKTQAAPGETITTSVANGPANPADWVGMYPASAPAEDGSSTHLLGWKYLSNNGSKPVPGLSAANLTWTMPSTLGTYHFRFFENDGYNLLATSSNVTVGSAPIAPSITTQPANTTVLAGQTATFSVVANGTAPLTYQWQKNGANISGGNSSSCTTSAVTTSDNGATFRVIVTNSSGTTTSNNALLTVTQGTPGAISREVWTNVPGATVSSIPANTAPNITDTLPNFEGPTNWGDNYGTRMRGYLQAPADGNYTFWIASDDNSELWLSTDSNPANKVKIASVPVWTNPREWNRYSEQKSAAIPLVQGRLYFIEALQKEGGGGDNLAIGWARPGQSTAAPSEAIPGSALIPFGGGTAPSVGFSSTASSGSEATTPVNLPVVLSAAASQSVTVNYSVSGTATGGGTDYTLANGPLSFAPGETSKNITITVVDDAAVESDETIVVTLSGPVNATLGANTVHTYTINNNDTAPVAPAITTQPAHVSAALGQTATFAVSASGTALSYQWQKNGTNIGGANGSSYTTPPVSGGDQSATFRVVVSNAAGSVTSNSATLTVTQPANGVIAREVWTNVQGTNISDIPLTTPAAITDTLTSFEAPTNWADNYGSRLRGYIKAPTNGAYTFWIASDDNSELWLSTSSNPANKVKIAFVPAWTNSREWNRYSEQKSGAITLTQGQFYYVEVLQKEGGGGDNLAVGWAKPGESNAAPSEVIPGAVLTPFSSGFISREVWTGIQGSNVSDINWTTSPNIKDTLTSFEAPSNWADNYGTRLRGYLQPPANGVYTFWIASDDHSELWLSPTSNPADKVKVAFVRDWTNPREWTRYPEQKSAGITLTQGQLCYVEVLQKEGGGGDNLAVAWSRPGESTATASEVIPGSVLLPFVGGTPVVAPPTITSHPANSSVRVGESATFSVIAAGASPLSYQWQKNGANIPGGIGSTYTTPVTTASENGALFRVIVTNPGGSVTSNSATLTVSQVTTGGISREVWTGVGGTGVSSIPLNTAPAITDILFSLEAPTNWADYYGSRLRGYIQAPATGSYTFWIASDDNSELWISTNSNPLNKVKIASVPSWTNPRQWNQFSEQKSRPITLTQGNLYYMEVLQKEDGGGDNLAVGWAKSGQPTNAPSEVIPGTFLSPWSTVQAPSITTQPSNTSVTAGQTATFVVRAIGTPAPTFQWQKNGVTIPGATSAAYTTPPTTPSDHNSTFRVVVTISAGSVTSTAAILTVGSAQQINGKIIAGDSHNFAIRADDTLWSWGRNDFGQLGLGNKVDQLVPRQITGLSGAIAAAGGTEHSLVVDSAGFVWAFGRNNSGKLGDGTIVDQSIPVRLTGLGNTVIAVAAGANHSLALKSDGSVWAWGHGGSGRLGNGTGQDSLTPTPVTGLGAGSGVVAIAAGGEFSLALKSNGTLWGWGRNFYGQLGLGNTSDAAVPTQASSISGVTAIAGGNDFVMVLKSDGTVWGAGINWAGQLGTGATNAGRVTFAPIIGVTGIIAVETGRSHTVALKSDGTVLGWGENNWGQLGSSTPSYILTAAQVPNLTGIVALAAGYHTLAARSDGTIVGCGENVRGALGDETTGNRTQVVPISDFTLNRQVDLPQFSPAGGDYPVALNVSLTCATPGAIIHYTTNGSDPGISDPAVVSGSVVPVTRTTLLRVKAFKTGLAPASHAAAYRISTPIITGRYSSFVIRPDGTLWDWGRNDVGQLGLGTITAVPTPTLLPVPSARAVANGLDHVLVVDGAGSLWAIGSNSNGKLGDGTTTNSLVPKKITSLGNNVVQVAAGDLHSLALKSDGSVWAWGHGGTGRLGDGTQLDRWAPVPVTGLAAGSGVIAIAARQSTSFALKSDGTLWAWGWNPDGQLGIGNAGTSLVVPTLVGPSKVAAISAGGQHTVALKADGTVWCAGRGWNGQLGNGVADAGRPVFTKVANLSGGVAIAAGENHTGVIRTDGSVLLFGINNRGQMGDGTSNSRLLPAPLNGVTDAVNITAGDHTLLVRFNGADTFWSWGNNDQAQCGVPGGISITTPQRIEFAYFDSDGDGLSDVRELELGTNIYLPDSNGNGFSDSQDLALGWNPLDSDSDDDGLTNAQETALGTNPLRADTDRDGVPDPSDYFPLDPARSNAAPFNPDDLTPPTITLTTPPGATLVNP